MSAGVASALEQRVAVRVIDAVKVYGSGATAVRALDGVSVDFAAGTFTAIMGPSGSGKSTLLHCLAGLDTLTSGTVLFDGADISTMSDKRRTRLRRERFGFIFQAFNLLPTLTAADNISLPMSLAHRLPDKEWLRKVIEITGLGPRLRHRPAQLSGGEQQRVAAARALASRPDVVFADEPTGNLDSRASADLLDFMRRMVDDYGQTIILVTHDPSAASHADHVLFLADGRLAGELPTPTEDRILDRMRTLGGERDC